MCHELHRGSNGAIWGWVLNTVPQLLYSWKTNQVATAQEDRQVPNLVRTGVENLA